MADAKTHTAVTLRVAQAADIGFTQAEARDLAKANTSTDRPPFAGQRYRHENTGWPRRTSQKAAAEQELQTALETGSLVHLGRGLHSVQDEIWHTFPVTGSYVHWYEREPDRHPALLRRMEDATREYLRRYRAGRVAKESP